MATARCCAPPLHTHAAPEGRVKRHLLPFPPAAAENNQRGTKSQATQRRCQETVPKRNAQLCTHSYDVYVHTLLCAVYHTNESVCPLSSQVLLNGYCGYNILLIIWNAVAPFQTLAIKHSWNWRQQFSTLFSGDDDHLHHLSLCTILNPIWGKPPCHEKWLRFTTTSLAFNKACSQRQWHYVPVQWLCISLLSRQKETAALCLGYSQPL